MSSKAAPAATSGTDIPREQLATLHVKRVIFHDIPRRIKAQEQAPTLSEVECTINPSKVALLKDKLVRVLTSSAAYDLEISPDAQSSVPQLVETATGHGLTAAGFVSASQAMATALLEHQPGSASPGLLAVVSCTVGGGAGVALLKLEREEGAQLKLSDHGGKKTFEMDILGDLVLTDGTKLFKSALFARAAGHEHEYGIIACDGQRSYTWTDELAQFWSRFLGCKLREAPRITTKKFFDATIQYINEAITEPEAKNDLYDSIISEMKSQKKTFTPKTFIEDYVPEEHRDAFREYLLAEHVTLKQFPVDTTEIKSHLKRRSLQTATGVRITVPPEADEVVEVQTNHIVIADSVISVGP
jgi:37-kD nucleoid-associated bacterial protein